jgi:hypothetical protein
VADVEEKAKDTIYDEMKKLFSPEPKKQVVKFNDFFPKCAYGVVF